MAMAACYPTSNYYQPRQRPVDNDAYRNRVPPPDYATPLHVDCSVEYELPDCAKPPQGVKVEPLLMIHPCHFRNLERQRRRPFEINLPRQPPVDRCCDYAHVNQCLPDQQQQARYVRGTGSTQVVRGHPYLAACAPRAPAPPCPLQRHQPTLIYNV